MRSTGSLVRWYGPLGVALCAAVVVLLVAVVALPVGTRDAPAAGVTAPAAAVTTTPIEEMTGKDVGLALGLEPMGEGNEVVDCPTVFAQFENGVGFCIGGVTDDEVEEIILALQINGYQRTELVEAYAAAHIEWRNSPYRGETAEHVALMRNVSDLAEQLESQGQAEE